MKLSEVLLWCAACLICGVFIGAELNAIQTHEECTLYGKTELNGTVFTCIEHKP